MIQKTVPTNKIDLSGLAEKWPSTIVFRGEIKNFTGGMVAPGTLANADCSGEGPAGRFKIGKKTGYTVKSLISWLESRAN